jgi:hypothetical protein
LTTVSKLFLMGGVGNRFDITPTASPIVQPQEPQPSEQDEVKSLSLSHATTPSISSTSISISLTFGANDDITSSAMTDLTTSIDSQSLQASCDASSALSDTLEDDASSEPHEQDSHTDDSSKHCSSLKEADETDDEYDEEFGDADDDKQQATLASLQSMMGNSISRTSSSPSVLASALSSGSLPTLELPDKSADAEFEQSLTPRRRYSNSDAAATQPLAPKSVKIQTTQDHTPRFRSSLAVDNRPQNEIFNEWLEFSQPALLSLLDQLMVRHRLRA